MSLRLAAFLLSALIATAADYDVLIRNARVVDGTGNPWFYSDIGVKDGKIAAIGRLENHSATRTIDAAHRIAAPGFIDVHTHVEGEIDRVPRADNFLLDGVTTIITGNCGGSRINLAEYFAKLEKQGLGINFASFIGHNTVRAEGWVPPTASPLPRKSNACKPWSRKRCAKAPSDSPPDSSTLPARIRTQPK